MNKITENPVLNILGVILIGVLLAGETVLYQVQQEQSSYSLDTVNPAGTYYETNACYVNMLEEAESVAETYMGEGTRFEKLQGLNDRFSPQKSNSRYQIESADGKLNLAKLFKAQFSREDRLIILDLCDGEFVFDVIEQPYSTRTAT